MPKAPAKKASSKTAKPKAAPAKAPAKSTATKTVTPEQKATEMANKLFKGAVAKVKSIDSAKVESWQQKWLALPANRKKMERWYDAPQVATEEVLAMTNDIIDFMQKQEGGQSLVFKKLKEGFKSFKQNPWMFVHGKLQKGADVAKKAAEKSAAKKTSK